jgi:hypothetical protein
MNRNENLQRPMGIFVRTQQSEKLPVLERKWDPSESWSYTALQPGAMYLSFLLCKTRSCGEDE